MKKTHKFSYSVLSIKISYNDFLFNLSKDLIVIWSRSYWFLYLLYLFMINLYNTLLPNDRIQAIPADIGKKFRTIAVTDIVIEVDVDPMIMILCIDSNIVFSVLCFLYFFLDLLFLSLKYVNNSLMLLLWLLKLLTSVVFFFNR